jgi:hypothetical protein
VSPKSIRVVLVSGWVETEAAVALVERLAAEAESDYDTTRMKLMKSIGGNSNRPAEQTEGSSGSHGISSLAAGGHHHRSGIGLMVAACR